MTFLTYHGSHHIILVLILSYKITLRRQVFNSNRSRRNLMFTANQKMKMKLKYTIDTNNMHLIIYPTWNSVSFLNMFLQFLQKQPLCE